MDYQKKRALYEQLYIAALQGLCSRLDRHSKPHITAHHIAIKALEVIELEYPVEPVQYKRCDVEKANDGEK